MRNQRVRFIPDGFVYRRKFLGGNARLKLERDYFDDCGRSAENAGIAAIAAARMLGAMPS